VNWYQQTLSTTLKLDEAKGILFNLIGQWNSLLVFIFVLLFFILYHHSKEIKYKNIHKIKQQDKINRMLMGMNIFQYYSMYNVWVNTRNNNIVKRREKQLQLIINKKKLNKRRTYRKFQFIATYIFFYIPSFPFHISKDGFRMCITRLKNIREERKLILKWIYSYYCSFYS
jgi:hypothetical protein